MFGKKSGRFPINRWAERDGGSGSIPLSVQSDAPLAEIVYRKSMYQNMTDT